MVLTDSFRDITDDILDGSPSVEPEVEDTPAAPAEPESRSEDKPAADPAATATPEATQPEADKPAAEGTPDQPKVEASAPTPEQPVPDPDPEVEVGNGEKVRLSELRQGYLRQADYTRKRQEDSRRAETAEQRAAGLVDLTAKMSADADMQEFLRAHPEALPHLLQEPEATRALLGNPRKLNEFWEDYELLAKNPRLAERISAQPADSPEAQQAIQTQRVAQRVTFVAENLERAVREVGKAFPGVDSEEVAGYVLELGGIRDDSDPVATAQGFGRLYNLFFVQTQEGLRIDSKVIRDRFELLQSRAQATQTHEEAATAQHNATVDAELARAVEPVAPVGGSPAAAPEKEKVFDNFEDTVHDLLYG